MANPSLMTRAERTDLIRIVKQRIALLGKQGEQRVTEIKRMIREQITEEFDEDRKRAEKEGEKLVRRAQKLEEDARALEAKFSEKGLMPGVMTIEQRYAGNTRRNYAVASPGVLVGSGSGDYGTGRYRSKIATGNSWVPQDLDNRVKTAYAKLKEQYGFEKLDLEQLELELVEELLIGGLETTDAKQFLANKIPTVDKMVPLPSGTDIKAIGRGEAKQSEEDE